jgi:hypothetical protein
MFATSILAPALLLAGTGLVVPANVTIGKNLEAFASIKLAEPAPEGGLEITIVSDDPTRLLLARAPDQAGARSITMKVSSRYLETPDFYLQALADSGSVTYKATAPGLGAAKGTVTLAPAGVLIVGPFEASSLRTTPSVPSMITLYSALLDRSGSVVAKQAIAGGLTVHVDVTSSDAKVGSVTPSRLTLTGGAALASAEFKPAGAGKTTLAASVPAGFSASARLAAVTAIVDLPGIALLGEISLGKNLQLRAEALLGEPAPANGVDVTLTSDDPQGLILSTREDQVGSKSITTHVPAGGRSAPYYIQALADSRTVTYTATAPGYRSRVAPVYLAPSAILIAYTPYGFGSRNPGFGFPPFTLSLSDQKPVQVTLWPVYLDPKTRRGADSNGQRLRAGVTATVDLKSSNPVVAKIASSVTIGGDSDCVTTQVIPLSVGQTVISVNTPAGFATPSNAATVVANVTK